MMDLYNTACFECSKVITKKYSTSFSWGIRAFKKELRNPVYAIYGFVRYADEIVDTFHDYDKQKLLSRFREETFEAIASGISINPVLHAFQQVVNQYQIDLALINSFLDSMEMDLKRTSYSPESFRQYIYGSAEVIGLMCLKVFCGKENGLYEKLVPGARKLGAAFQKINFLRDIKSDYEERGRVYLPGIDLSSFSEHDKKGIELDIQEDFKEGLKGIRNLPACAKKGVYVAYLYYTDLFRKIKATPVQMLAGGRIRISDKRKLWLMAHALFIERIKAI